MALDGSGGLREDHLALQVQLLTVGVELDLIGGVVEARAGRRLGQGVVLGARGGAERQKQQGGSDQPCLSRDSRAAPTTPQSR